ncbi:Hydroxysteroid 11-beta-dehydrogenase 1-like protein [Varanus komodoensis]|nr:Hydroxysteroid 11-beta-dehydrogenase 1-like protein [Varanus komodoensis]
MWILPKVLCGVAIVVGYVAFLGKTPLTQVEHIMRKAGLDESQVGIKIAGRNIYSLTYADDTTLMAESEEELKSLLMRVKEESAKVGLKLNIKKTKIMASGSLTSWQIDGEEMDVVTDFIFLGSKITADGDCSQEIKRRLLLGRKTMANLDSIQRSRDITLPTNVRIVKAMVFPVAMYGYESWIIRKAEELRPLDCGAEGDACESPGPQGDQTDTLAGARVLITGVSCGIGEQVPYHYARFQAQIVLTARRETLLQKLSWTLLSKHQWMRLDLVTGEWAWLTLRKQWEDRVMEKFLKLGAKKVFCFPADMASPEEPKKLVQFTLEHLGGLDYVVLNHIGWIPFAVWDGDVDHIRGLMQVNFLSYVTSAAAALPALTESKGSLLVVSSLLERIATPFMTTYSATKFALEGFFGSFCHELAMKKKDVSMTLYILGLTDMELSLNKTRDVTLTAAPASKAALAIVKGGSTRAREVFYPWTIQMLCWI